MRLRIGCLVALAAVAATVTAREASACSCLPPGIDLPADGAAGVPTNVRVLFSPFSSASGRLSLHDPTGAEVPSTTESPRASAASRTV